MKSTHYLYAVIFSIIFYSCDHTVKTQTVVNSDGSLDRTITLQGDSSDIETNFFGINEKSGWEVSIAKNDSSGLCQSYNFDKVPIIPDLDR